MKNIITTKNLTIGFEKNRKKPVILHSDLYIDLPEGEFCCLLGPNGAGKSTLLRTLVGFQNPIVGEIFLNNKNINNFSEKELSILVSIVITEKPDTENLSVKELVSLGRYPYTGFFGKLTLADNKIVEQAMEIVGIGNFKHRLVSQLSDGEKQKAMIAKAFAQDTPVIVLDEPTAFLDIPGRIEIMQLLRKLSANSNKTILVATHNLELALQFSDKIILLARDKEIVSGAPEDLVLQDKISSFFENKGISFEKLSGTFIVKSVFENTIQVSGDQPTKEWLSRALGKIGFNTDNKANTDLRIEIIDQSPSLVLFHDNKKILKTHLIEEIVRTIKNMKQ
jgi:iron complex transport system ATP-binding protein